jgi:protein-S-isoprenylcysteine O-methyltransferase Ste14
MRGPMTIWGVGPRLAFLSFGYSIIPVFLTFHYPEYFVITSVPTYVFSFAGIILPAVGIPFWALSARTIARGFKDGVLCTRGGYSIVRHPLYSALIVFVIPGILMFFRYSDVFPVLGIAHDSLMRISHFQKADRQRRELPGGTVRR